MKIKKIKKLLQSERGEASYISTVIYILVVVILLTFILNVFHIISVKQKMDHMADQMVKQIQLIGCVNEDTEALFRYLSVSMTEVDALSYSVDCSVNIRRIQIGTPFYVTVSGNCYLGGFWKFNLVPITVTANGAGVSEHYWK